jgi:nicotinate-nucleotide adenylyltransferase
MKLALYGGTFDPIHHGHLILAREALESLGLDRVVFIPAAQSPHKLHREPAPPRVRLEMVRAAIAGEPRFTCDDAEVERPGPSFTIDTVERTIAQQPGAELFYLIGHDNVRELHTWRRIDELRQLVRFVVFDRDGCDAAHDFLHITRQVDVSATDVRTRVAHGASIRYLVPEPVRAIIAREKLYPPSVP